VAAKAARHSICEIKWREAETEVLIQILLYKVQLKDIGTSRFIFSSQFCQGRELYRSKMGKKVSVQ
jgi:hypothetical protein